ncbi:sulfurtransferase [Halorhabdus tiamatea]|uniref:Thiosulfate sulfurtransferase, rhodanese n=2 Tax=Halorhabdus tiamatea SARL4B TaxID=1033806 RepID=F7PG87_9EURY|nr:rhodanese-like domain-containing protein [Halorhabdus tiamatea]CCQ34634.1 thiosulfate sulfurtransferase, rhodanese [Halorhabdus tiamatea SARL4B]
MTDARSIEPIVSTAWVADHRSEEDLVVVDARGPTAYENGHIPGAVNAPKWTWMDAEADLLLTLPDADDLFETLGSLGIAPDSRVVVVGSTGDTFDLADAANAADTLIYAGLDDVAILDGGHTKWVGEDRPTEEGAVVPTATEYAGELDQSMFVMKDEVTSRLADVTLLDTRSPEAYFGAMQEDFTDRPGHIPGASCLPAAWIWTDEGTFKSPDEFEALVEGLVGADRSQEMILYCGASPFSKSWRYVMQEVLGYENARVYNGAAQEWTQDPDAPLNRYCWE